MKRGSYVNKKLLIFFVLFIFSNIAILFFVKYTVKNKVLILKKLQTDIAQKLQEIHIMKAELALFSQPSRIKSLSLKSHLEFHRNKNIKYIELEQILNDK